MQAVQMFTVGHSTKPVHQLIADLRKAGVRAVADVRTYPYSRHCPQFNQPTLAHALQEAGIDYHHMPELGGKRQPRPDSPHANVPEPLRGFADFMDTPTFAEAIKPPDLP